MVHLRSHDFRVIPRSAAILTWSIRLEQGNLQKLAMLGEDFLIPHVSMFPGTRISLLDAYNNACFDHELEKLTMVIGKTGTTIHIDSCELLCVCSASVELSVGHFETRLTKLDDVFHYNVRLSKPIHQG
jgi:hypothetical protein